MKLYDWSAVFTLIYIHQNCCAQRIMGYCNNVRTEVTPTISTKCVVCKFDNVTWHYIYSDAGKKKRLSELLKIYGEINVIEVVVFEIVRGACWTYIWLRRCYTEVQFNENTPPKYNVMNLNSSYLNKCQIKFLIPWQHHLQKEKDHDFNGSISFTSLIMFFNACSKI